MTTNRVSERLRCGVSRTRLSPPVGLRLAGSLRDGPSTAVHQDLEVGALYLTQRTTSIVIVTCDLIMLPPEDANAMRAAIADAVGMDREAVLLSVSHSHATLSPPWWKEYDQEIRADERAQVVAYFQRLADTMVDLALQAKDTAVEARVGSASGSSDINVNRRERRADGTMVLGSNPKGAADPEVAVLRIDSVSGEALALLFNYACHPDILGPKSEFISPDYVGPARDTAEAVSGAIPLFLQGAAGDIYPCTGIVDAPDGVEAATRLGRRLGAEAARVFETIYTHRRPQAREAWTSATSTVTHWRYSDVPPPAEQQLASVHSVIQLPLRNLPTKAEAASWAGECSAAVENLTGHETLSARLIAHRKLAWANLQLAAIVEGAPNEVPFEIQALRIGDTAIVALPGELFTEIGTAIKADSPFAHTIISAYSNGVYFYIPTRAAFDDGGYEIDSHKNYMRPAGPTPDWEEAIRNEAGRLLHELI